MLSIASSRTSDTCCTRVRVQQRGVFGEEATRERALHDLQAGSGHVKKAHGGHRAESGRSQGFPLAIDQRGLIYVWRDGCRLCVKPGSNYAARSGVRCAVGQHPPVAGRVWFGREKAPMRGRARGTGGEGGKGVVRGMQESVLLEVCGDVA